MSDIDQQSIGSIGIGIGSDDGYKRKCLIDGLTKLSSKDSYTNVNELFNEWDVTDCIHNGNGGYCLCSTAINKEYHMTNRLTKNITIVGGTCVNLFGDERLETMAKKALYRLEHKGEKMCWVCGDPLRSGTKPYMKGYHIKCTPENNCEVCGCTVRRPATVHTVCAARRYREQNPGSVVMTFGKHKGKSIDKVPLDYLKWVAINTKQYEVEYIVLYFKQLLATGKARVPAKK